MPKKPKLPGAADFFALPADEPDSLAPSSPPPAAKPKRSARPATTLTRVPADIPSPPAEAPLFAPPSGVPQGPTEKVTFYLNPLLLKRLELFKAQLLMDHNVKVNRSQIVELLLQEGLESTEALTEKLLRLAE